MNLPPEWDDEEYTDYEECGLYDKEDYYMDKYIIGHSEIELDTKENVDLPYVRTIPATRIVLCMSKIAHLIHNGELTGGKREWTEDDGTEISVVLQAAKMPVDLSAFDMAVYAAIASLYDCDIHEFSIMAVCRTLCLNPKMTRVGGKLRDAVQASVEKMSGIKAEIRWEPLGQQGEEHEGSFLGLSMFRGRTDNGHCCSFWRFTAPPMLYQYSLNRGECWRMPIKVLGTGNVVVNNIEAVLLRYCLLRRIAIICRLAKPQRETANRIAYRSLSKEVGLNMQSEANRKKMRNAIRKCFKCWKRAGLIVEYSDYKKHKEIIGIEIQVERRTKGR